MSHAGVNVTLPGNSVKLKEVSNVWETWDVNDACCETNAPIYISHKLVRFPIISWKKIPSLRFDCLAQLCFVKCWVCYTENISSPRMITTHLRSEQVWCLKGWEIRTKSLLQPSPSFSLLLSLVDSPAKCQICQRLPLYPERQKRSRVAAVVQCLLEEAGEARHTRGWTLELKRFRSSTTFVFNLNTHSTWSDFVKCKALKCLFTICVFSFFLSVVFVNSHIKADNQIMAKSQMTDYQ